MNYQAIGKHLFGTTALAACLSTGHSAYAQELTDEPIGLEEIIVTAQRRAESVQDTALSIDVVRGETLQVKGIENTNDLTKLAPGIQASSGTVAQFYIRGVGDFGIVANANPGVVTSLNGVVITRPQAINGNIFDLERVEILKGPQGTLYGRNSTGGAINYIPVRPKLGELSGYLDAIFGNYNQFGAEGAVNVPAGDNLAFRISGQFNDREGFLSDGTNDDVHESIRFQAQYEPTEALSIHFGSGYTHLGGVGSGFVSVPTPPGADPFSGTTSQEVSDFYRSIAEQRFIASGMRSVPPALLNTPVDDRDRVNQDVTSWYVDAQIDYDFGGPVLTIIPAYRRTEFTYSINPFFMFGPGLFDTDGDESDQLSLEARIGEDGERLKWVAGLFAFNEEQSSQFGSDSGLFQRIVIGSDLGTLSFAGFGEATYSVTDRFRISAGGRYTTDKRDTSNISRFSVSPTVTGVPPLPTTCTPDNGFAPGTRCQTLDLTDFGDSRTFKKFTWKVGIEYDITPENLIFANVSTGFKAGGFNVAVDPADTSRLLAFEPETITAYMIGSRNRFFDSRLQVNLEAFYWDYEDLSTSQFVFDGLGILSFVSQNVGAARIFGGNVDITAQVWEGGTFHVGVEYADSKYQEYNFEQPAAFTPPGATACAVDPSDLPPSPLGPFVSINCAGFDILRAPKWSGTVDFNQVFDLPNEGNLVFQSDLSFASSRFTNTSFTAASRVDGYINLSASVTYNAPDDSWYIRGFVRNITDALIITGGNNSQTVIGFANGTVLPPRTYGVRAGVRF